MITLVETYLRMVLSLNALDVCQGKIAKKTFSLSCRNKPVVIGIYLYFSIYADNDVHVGSFGIIIFRAYWKVEIWLTIHTHWQSLNQRQLPKTIASHRADLLPKTFSISVY